MSKESSAQIPVIDISAANSSAPQQLLSAASKYGFIFIENNDAGILQSDIDRMFGLSETFFHSSLNEKEGVSISSNKAGKNHGWLSRGVEKLDPKTQIRPDVKEAFNIGFPIPPSLDTLQQPLPPSLDPHAKTILAFQQSCQNLCMRLLTQLATALQIPSDWFTTRHDHALGASGTVFRLLYYPKVNAESESYEDGVDIRAGAHSDYGSLTLLFQLPGQPGLEIKTPQGEWASVPVDPTNESGPEHGKVLPILVNIGDLLEDWTDGLLKSTVHRVIFPLGSKAGGDRYSMAYFCHPLDDALLEPVPSEVVREHATGNGSARSRKGERGVMTAKDHLMARLAETYKVGGH